MERIEINGNYDRILGEFELRRGDGSTAIAQYARQGRQRFVADVDIPDGATEEERKGWVEFAKQARDSDVAKSRGLRIRNQVGFRPGEWQGNQISKEDLVTIQDNYQKLSEYAPNTETERPFLLNHDDSIEKKVGRIENVRSQDDAIYVDVTLTAPSAIEEYLCGNYRAISPHLRKNYSFDTGQGKALLPGWTLREVSFVTDGGDKHLNLHLKEAKMGIEELKGSDNKEQLLLRMSEESLKLKAELKQQGEVEIKLKEDIQRLTKENEEKDARLREVSIDLIMKELVSKKKVLPADVPDWKTLVLKMSEAEAKAWQEKRLNGADVLDTNQWSKDLPGGAQTQNTDGEADDKEIACRVREAVGRGVDDA